MNSSSPNPLLHPSSSSFSSSAMRRPSNYKKRKTSHEHSPPARDECSSLFTAKPTAVFTPSGGRTHTLSVAIPGSIVANAHSIEQKTFLAGIIARALAVFCVDEVVIFDDEQPRSRNYRHYDDGYDSPIAKTSDELNASTKGYTAYSDPSHFLAHVLSYLETPPYLRKHLFPMHPNLRGAGLLPSLDMPHHLRAHEWCDYREGIVLSSSPHAGRGRNGSQMSLSPNRHSPRNSPPSSTSSHAHTNPTTATVVDTGLSEKVVLPDIQLPDHARVTVRFSHHGHDHYAEPVHPSAPRAEAGYYWGYYVRRCRSLSSVFTECPFDGGYDLSFGTSERGAPVGDVLEDEAPYRRPPHAHRPDYQHLLVVFGGVAGIEAAVRNDPQLRDMDIRPTDAGKLFDYWINLLPGQGSRTIRTEEALWLGLTSLRGLVEGTHRAKRSYRYHGS